MAQGGAGAAFSGVATDRLAGTTAAVLNAVSFPRFVTELITGVFKAMNNSNQQQMQAYVDLIRNVAATTEGLRRRKSDLVLRGPLIAADTRCGRAERMRAPRGQRRSRRLFS